MAVREMDQKCLSRSSSPLNVDVSTLPESSSKRKLSRDKGSDISFPNGYASGERNMSDHSVSDVIIALYDTAQTLKGNDK